MIDDFPHLPAGCQINLDRVASESVLRSIRGSLPRNQAARAAELAQLGDVSLRVFLEQSMLELADVYAGSNYWTALRRRAGFVPALSEDREAQLGRGFGRILHYDDFARLRQLAAILGAAEPPAVACLTEQQRRLLQMFGLSICSPKKSEKISLSDVLAWLWRSAPLRQEFVQLAEVMAEQVVHLAAPLGIEDVPLQVHATYSRAEVMAAFGAASLEHPGSFREGVYWHEPSQTNLCFVTLDKTDSGFSPTTRYKDYAINEQLFHWETQSGVGPDTPTGKRYIEQRRNGTRVVLFARERKSDGAGNTAAFFCLGLADYVSHQGERPIAITWQLRNPLPGDRFAAFRAAVA